MANTEYFLPKDKLPDCWNDETRMNVLFAPFRDKSVNPKDWENKYEFWKNLIYQYCIHNRVYVFTYPELAKKFLKNGRSPAALQFVIEQMYKNGDIKPLQIFGQKPADTWSGWVTDTFVKKPMVWSFTKLKDSIVATDKNISYVHISAVEEESNKLLNKLPISMKDKVIDLHTLMEFLKFNDTEQLNILLHSLVCKGKVSTKIVQNKNDSVMLVKFYDLHSIKGICDRDIDVYMLEESEKTLTEDIEKLEHEVTSLVKNAKLYLSKNQRQSAKTCLRKKKETERCIEKRANTLHNVQILLSRVKDVDSDAQILDSYKKALSSLRTTFSETGLSEESVTNTMIELDEVLEIHDDIQATLSKGGNVTIDSDLEEELAEILKLENSEEENKKDTEKIEEEFKNLDIVLPSPPKDIDNFRDQRKVSL